VKQLKNWLIRSPLFRLDFWITIGASCVLLFSLTQARASSVASYQLQAAYIYQFTNYIDWPNETSDSTQPFIIAILGDSPVADELEKLAKVKQIKGRTIQVQKHVSLETLKKPQILVLSREIPSERDVVLKFCATKGILTISHSPEAAENGIMINFFTEEGKLRYEVNRKAFEKEKFRVSSQLLKLARIVEPKNGK
jgi:hypothetical protein